MVKIYIIVRRGRGSYLRLINVKDKSNYEMVSRVGRYYVYERIKKKRTRKRRRSKRRRWKVKGVRRGKGKGKRGYKVLSDEEKAIRKLKGIYLKEKSDRVIERELLLNARKFQYQSRKFIAKKLNPKGLVMTDGKIYSSFRQMERGKHSIYKRIIFRNLHKKEFIEKIYRNRRTLLRDGMIIKVRCFGTLDRYGKLRGKLRYLGTFEITGLLIEDAGFIENDLIGLSGYLSDVESSIVSKVKGRGGKHAICIISDYWIKYLLILERVQRR